MAFKTEHFIAKRIVFASGTGGNFSRPIVRIAIGGIALGLAVMIISIAIVTGFKNQISEKVIGFGGHVQVSNFDSNFSYEASPIEIEPELRQKIRNINGVSHLQGVATKAGIVKTDEDILGIVLKGVGTDYDWHFLSDKLVSGRLTELTDTARSNEVIISSTIANKLNLKVGDALKTYFIQQPPRVRNFNIVGIYETGLEEFDKLYVFCDIGHIRKLNDWDENQLGALEVNVNNMRDLNRIGDEVYNAAGMSLDARTIREIYPQIFDWLDLQNINVIIIITLIILVAGINMISALLIIILERTNMIGILKAMGSPDKSIRNIFILTATYLLGRGLFWGNLIGLGLCFFQYQTGIFTLSQESYYVSVVPINFSFGYFALLNLGTMAVCSLMMIAPSMIVTRISPLKAIRFS